MVLLHLYVLTNLPHGQGITAIKACFSSKTVRFKKPTCVSWLVQSYRVGSEFSPGWNVQINEPQGFLLLLSRLNFAICQEKISSSREAYSFQLAAWVFYFFYQGWISQSAKRRSPHRVRHIAFNLQRGFWIVITYRITLNGFNHCKIRNTRIAQRT